MVLVEARADKLALETQLPDDKEDVVKKLEADTAADLDVAIGDATRAGSRATATIESAF